MIDNPTRQFKNGIQLYKTDQEYIVEGNNFLGYSWAASGIDPHHALSVAKSDIYRKIKILQQEIDRINEAQKILQAENQDDDEPNNQPNLLDQTK